MFQKFNSQTAVILYNDQIYYEYKPFPHYDPSESTMNNVMNYIDEQIGKFNTTNKISILVVQDLMINQNNPRLKKLRLTRTPYKPLNLKRDSVPAFLKSARRFNTITNPGQIDVINNGDSN